jgi:hypothetical protein
MRQLPGGQMVPGHVPGDGDRPGTYL